jgi:O-antigen/teichoic acid export membrane protein
MGFRLVTRAITLISGAVVGAIIGRAWGVDALGFYASVTVLTNVLGFAFDLGLPGLLRRRIAYDPSQGGALLSSAFALLPVAWLGGTLCSVVSASLLVHGESSLIPTVLAASGWMIASTLNDSLSAVFTATGRMGLETKGAFVERIALVPLAVLVVSLTQSMAVLFLAMALAKCIAIAINTAAVRGIVGRPTSGSDRFPRWEMARAGVPFWVHNLFSMLYQQQSVLLLTALASIYDVGLYRSASLFVVQIPVVAVALNDALFPRIMQRWAAGDRSGLLRGIRSSLLLTTAVGVLAAVGLMVAAGPLITFLYGAAFTPAAPGLAILALGVPFAFANNSIGMYLTVVDRQKQRATISAVGALVGAGLNLLLIPRHGFLGAATAMPLTEATVVALLGIASWRHIRSPDHVVSTPHSGDTES